MDTPNKVLFMAIVFTAIALYLGGSFVSASFDFKEWNLFTRVFVAVFFFMMLFQFLKRHNKNNP